MTYEKIFDLMLKRNQAFDYGKYLDRRKNNKNTKNDSDYVEEDEEEEEEEDEEIECKDLKDKEKKEETKIVNSSFIFSFSNKKIFKKDISVNANKYNGPNFYSKDFYDISINSSMDKGETSSKIGYVNEYSNLFSEKFSKNYIQWNIKELEVYKIIYI